MATSLLDLSAVQVDSNDDSDLSDEGTTTIGGKDYGRALVYSCNTFCGGGSPQTRTVTLGGQYATFVAWAAVLDQADGTHRIDITLDSGTPHTYNVKPGKAQLIKLSVRGVYRMRIQMYAPGPLKGPLQAGADSAAGKNGGGLPGVALADPMLQP